MRNSRPIFNIEDNRGDAMIFNRVLKDLEINNPLVHLTDCEEALEHLRDQSKEKPCLIIMDLNTPKMNGLEFLRIVKADDVLKQIPVIILTGSDTEEDITASFALGAVGYVTKPADYNELTEAIKAINAYWTLSKLPNLNSASLPEQICQTTTPEL